MDGGCDHGYSLTPCLWGKESEPLLEELMAHVDVSGLSVLDAGCGEGRNAVRLASRGAGVLAVDVSELALKNARENWPDAEGIEWRRADLLEEAPEPDSFDVVLCDSVLHWMPDAEAVAALTASLQRATRPGGVHMVCSFNDRRQEFGNHLNPPRCVIGHDEYMALYGEGWEVLSVLDEDITSSHADVPEPHHHSVTKFLARRTS